MLALAVTFAFLAAATPQRAKPQEAPLAKVEVSFEHELSAPDGILRLTWPSIAYDREHRELFVVAEGFVRIFDAAGMEVHRFGDDGSLGYVSRVAPLDDGEIVVLTSRDGKRAFLRCDFRGEPLEEFELSGLPKGFDDFQPDQLVYRNGRLFFAERGRMRVVVTDVTGVYRQSFRLRDLVAAAVAGDDERKPPGAIDAFNVDARGNVLFTMSTMFAAGILSPAGEVRIFGARGSTPGKFNVVGAIDVDERGYVFVTDRLRSVVSVWSPELRHLADFGYRGGHPTSLLTPYEIAVGNGKVFVAQAGKRGVKVFRVTITEPEPAPVSPVSPAPAPPTPPRPTRGNDRPRARA